MSTSYTGQSEPSFMSGADLNMSEALARNWWAMALRGVLAIVFGVIALVLPGVTMLSLVIVFAAYALVDGVLAIVAAVRSARRHERWGLLVLEGVVDIAAGVLAFLWPGLTIVIFVLLVAASTTTCTVWPVTTETARATPPATRSGRVVQRRFPVVVAPSAASSVTSNRRAEVKSACISPTRLLIRLARSVKY